LYAALDILQERVQYTDSDSVIFFSLPHENNPPLGDFFGDFKDELGEDDLITEFASAGPKNYGYLMNKEKEECKVRGISLNSESVKQLNYKVLRQNVLGEIQRRLEKTRQTDIYKPYHIVRDSKEYSLFFVQNRHVSLCLHHL